MEKAWEIVFIEQLLLHALVGASKKRHTLYTTLTHTVPKPRLDN